MNALITGATGFVGSHLARRMVADGYHVKVFIRSRPSLEALPDLPLDVAIGEITDQRSVSEAVRGCEVVVHAAANLSYWGKDRTLLQQVNVEGTRTVAEACRREGVQRLLHVSSVAAIGIPDFPAYPADEAFAFNLEGRDLPYHLSKHRAERIVLDQVRRGLDAVIVNPASIFGRHGTTYRGADMLRKVRRTRIVPYFTGGICVVHVDDVVEGMLAALRQGVPGERYILGGENITWLALARQTAAAIGIQRWFVPVLPAVTALASTVLEPLGRWRRRRPAITHVTHYCASRCHFYSSEKARRTFGYTARSFHAILDECLHMNMC